MTGTVAARIAACLPGAGFELEALVRLVGVQETTEVRTAAVTCEGRSRLQVNPEFVGKYCERDEHLFLLVMHELWHVLLGHTTLFGRPTPEHNVAFDALINAGLAGQHAGPEFRGFFEAINDPDVFPNLLLRPPVGWPDDPTYDVPGPRGTGALLRRLYPPTAAGRLLPEPTYDELLDLLRRQRPQDSGSAPVPVLLGEHCHPDDQRDALADPVFGGVLRDMLASWPEAPVGARGVGGVLAAKVVQLEPTADAVRLEFRRVLRRALSPDPGGHRERRRVLLPAAAGRAPLPSAYDRLIHARRALGVPAVLYEQRATTPVRVTDPPQAALVYLDVSGSMAGLLPYLVDLLVPLARRRLVRVRQFSTEVVPLSVEDLVAGRLSTTGGTDIDCVLADAAPLPHRRILLLTDGIVGSAAPELLRPLTDRGVRIYAAVSAGGRTGDLAPYAEMTVLPELT